MKIRVITAIAACLFTVSIATPAHAQIGDWLHKAKDATVSTAKKAKDLRVIVKKDDNAETTADDQNAKAAEPAPVAKEDPTPPTAVKNLKIVNDDKPATAPANDEIPTPKHGDSARFGVWLTPAVACDKVRQLFVASDIELESGDCTVGQIRTRPVVRPSGLVDKARRTIVNFVPLSGGAEVRVKVMQKGSGFFSVNGGKTDGEKTEGVDVKGTMKMATQLRDYLRSQAPATVARATK